MPFAESKESHGFNRGRMSICLYQNRNSRSQKQNHPGARRVSYLALKNQASSRRTKRYSGKCSERKRKAACNDNENLASRKRTRNIFSLVKKKLLRSENREEADGGEFNSRFLDLDKSTRDKVAEVLDETGILVLQIRVVYTIRKHDGRRENSIARIPLAADGCTQVQIRKVGNFFSGARKANPCRP